VRGAWLALAGAVAGACVPSTPPPRAEAGAPDLAAARAGIRGLAGGPLAEEAPEALAEAEQAVSEAERALQTPGAGDAAYVALRKVESARLAAIHAHEALTLWRARAEVRRLAEAEARRAALRAELARRREADALALAAAAQARRRAFAEALGDDSGGAILEGAEGIGVRIAAEALFLPGTSLLRDGAALRLAAVAAALRVPPACDVRVEVLDDVEGRRADPARLAARRRQRVRDVLVAHGVPAGAFLSPRRTVPAGVQIDVLAAERPPPR
jgi:outer membrane protein OmpA-like peptidoglycan-associated protein